MRVQEAKYREVEQRLWQSVGLKPEDHFVRLPRLGTTVRVQEVGEGSPVLFIHGGPNSGSTWATLIAETHGLKCFLLDRPGTGLSDDYVAKKDTLIDFASHLVADVLDGLEIEKAHVVASSLGGYCALWSASSTPERFDRLVQMACPALLPGQHLPPFMKVLMVPGMRKIIGVLPPNKKAQDSIMRQIGHGASLDAGTLPPAHDEWYTALQRYTDTMRNDGDMIYSVKAKGGFDEEVALGGETLSRVETPTHFLWGTDDTFGGEDVARWVTETMPNATLEMIPESGHLPWLDDPTHVGKETTRFLLKEPLEPATAADLSEDKGGAK